MCGIVGFWNFDKRPVSLDELTRFRDMLAHRGPDGGGAHIDEAAALGLGHRRLAIIDTTATGRQPMSFANERYWIVFNGEIYNFVELRKELESGGYRFVTDSDTEVILASYAKWGADCQFKFNGMWAFAIWDAQEQKIFLSRDRFGVKPLIYYFNGKRFAFASEMKAFLALDGFRVEFSPSVVSASLTDATLIEGTENCLLEGLKRLQGGHCLTLTRAGDLKIRRWWNTLEHLVEIPQRDDEQAEKYRELFLDACRIRMRSDVPIGTALSGGLDSSSVLSAMSHIRNSGDTTNRMAYEWQKAFIGTYPGKAIDERSYADEVIKHTGVTPVYCEMNADMYLQYFHQILYQYEELSDIHLGPWFVHKKQRENGVVVTIDGHGGDEALGGYTWHVFAAMKDAKNNPLRFLELVSIRNNMSLTKSAGSYFNAIKNFGGRLANKFRPQKETSWLTAAPQEFYSPAMEADMRLLNARDHLFQRLYTDFHFTHLPMVLRNFDRLSMAHGVEVRSPFMDWRLVCFAFSLPSDRKIGGQYTKQILRDAMKGILPEAIRVRAKKQGFTNLDESWASAKGQEFIANSINSIGFKTSAFWDGNRIGTEMKIAFQTQDRDQIYKAWKFAQAFYLMKAFKEKNGKL